MQYFAYALVQEKATQLYYQQLRAVVDEPVLGSILNRLSRDNVSFGAGAHHCLGTGLAHLEAEVAFAGFARRFTAAELAEVRWNGRINVRGPAMLTVAVR